MDKTKLILKTSLFSIKKPKNLLVEDNDVPVESNKEWSLFNGDLFEEFKSPNKPNKISQNLWNNTFPPDRENLINLTSKYFITGMDANLALKFAENEILILSYKKMNLIDNYNETIKHKELKSIFLDENDIIKIQFNSFLLSIHFTALKLLNDKIDLELDDSQINKVVFKNRTWHSSNKNCCLICDKSTENKMSTLFQNDEIHKENCLDLMKILGPIFVNAVLKRIIYIKDNNLLKKYDELKNQEDIDNNEKYNLSF